MTPALTGALLWALFAGTHFALSAERVRAPLAAQFGELGFLILFYAVASACLTALVTVYVAQRFTGAPGLALADILVLRWVPVAAIVSGRQRLVWRELPVEALMGIAVALALRTWHDRILGHGGGWFIGFFIAGSVAFGTSAWLRARRIDARQRQ
jgi:uncharacterized membrane protein